MTSAVFATTVRDGVCQLARSETRWLSSGFDGGATRADAAYNVTVPEGWTRTDLREYAAERRAAAGFDADGPTLLTGVAQRHARRARLGPVEAVVTAGLSNPATLPMDAAGNGARAGIDDAADPPVGTVNVLVGTTRALDDGALASLLATAVEAKTATLLAATEFTGTTSDAVVAACDPAGPSATFVGAATEVGRAARACVRDALRASLHARYADGSPPSSVAEARHGAVTDERAAVSRLD